MTSSHPSSVDDRVEMLVAECLERSPQEPTSVVDDVCSDDPGLAAEVRESLAALASLGLGFEARTADDEMPARLGSFRLVRPLGAGAMGVVYLAEKEPEGFEVALKVLRPELLYFPRAQQRFRREMRIVAGLKHPGIVRLHSHGETDGLPWIAMQRAPGATAEGVLTSLETLAVGRRSGEDLLRAIRALSDGADPQDGRPHPHLLTSWTNAALHLVREVALALSHAHARGVVHRDVKPSNLMLTPDGRALLFDFGLATEEARAPNPLTRSGVALGSEAYMAPEVLGGDSRADERSDIYSLGVVLFELLTGQRPFQAEGVAGFRARVLAGRTPSVRTLNGGVSEEADRVCRVAMARDPGARYQSAQALADDLGRVLEHRPVRARLPGRGVRALRWARRRPELVVGGLALLGAVVALLLLWQDNQRMVLEIEDDQRAVDSQRSMAKLLAPLELNPEMTAADIVEEARELLRSEGWQPLELGDAALAAARELREAGSADRARMSMAALVVFREHAPNDFERQALAVAEHSRALLLLGESVAARELVRKWTAASRELSDPLRAELLMLESSAYLHAHPDRLLEGLHEAEQLVEGSGRVPLQLEILLEQARFYQRSGQRARAREVEHRARLLENHESVDTALRRKVEQRVALGEKSFGDWNRALERFDTMIAQMEHQLSAVHLDLVEPLVTRCQLLTRLGRYAEALSSVGRAIKLVELQAGGHDAADTLHALATQAAAALGARVDAEFHAERAVKFALDSAVPNRMFHAWLGKARMWQALGDLAQAEAAYLQALSPEFVSAGRSGPAVQQAWVRANLGVLLLDAGRDAEAETQLISARALLESDLADLAEANARRLSKGREPRPETAPTTIGTHRMLGHVQLLLGNFEEAARSLAYVVELVSRLQSGDHWTVSFARVHLARALIQGGGPEGLDAAVEEDAWEVAGEVGQTSYTFRFVAEAMVELYAAQGDEARAAAWRERRGDASLQVPAPAF